MLTDVMFTQLWMCLLYLKEKGEEAYASSAAPNCPRACHDSQTENRRGKKKKKSHQQVCVVKHTPQCSCCITTTQLISGWTLINVACPASGATCNTADDPKMALVPPNYCGVLYLCR